MKSEDSIRVELIKSLEKQIDNVKRDNEFGFITENIRIQTLASILELNVYARGYTK